jgi:hypothetical protein
MSERAECSSRAVACVLDVIAFGRLVNLRVKLLLRPRVAILASIAGFTGRRIAPFVT